MDTVKENPVPAALVGVGLGWLLVDAIMKQQKGSSYPLTNGNYNNYSSGTYGDAGYGVARGSSYGSYDSTTGTYGSAGTNNFATAPNTGGVKSALDQAGNKLSETGEKIGDAVEGAKEKIGDAAQDISARASDIAHTVQDKAGDATELISTRLSESVRANPIPAAIAGVSLGWILLDALMKPHKHNEYNVSTNGYSGANYGGTGYNTASGTYASSGTYGTTTTGNASSALDSAGNKLSETGEKIGDAVDGAKAKLGDAAQGLQAKASDIAHTVQDKAGDATAAVTTNARKAASATSDFVTGNPLAAGLISLLVGTAVGLALPATRQENELMGTYRDKLADQAGQQAQDLLGKVQNVAEEAMDTAKTQLSQVTETVGKQIEVAKDNVQASVKTSVKDSGLSPS